MVETFKEKMKRINESAKKMIKKLEHDEKVAQRIKQLGEARAGDSVKIEEEDQVLTETVSEIDTAEIRKVIAQLHWLGDKKLAQIDDYIGNNVVDFASSKEFSKLLAKALWGTLNLVRILMNRELPPGEE